MRFIILVCCLLVLSAAVGQSVDSSFTAPIPLRQAKIEKILPAANGKFFIGGEITYHGNTRVHNLIKVHADGTLDNTFNFDRTYYSGTSGRSFLVTDIAQQPSGELVVIIHDYDPGLYIIEYASILLLNPDGSLINEKKIYSQVTALALQDDGKILVGGGGQLRRYHSDLTEDIQFNSKVTFNNSWISKVQQKDDYILVAGSFEYVNNVSHNQMVKLNLDGTIASGFNTGIGTNTGSNGAISTFFILDDGKVMIGFAPGFQGFNLHRGMGRLNADGSLDQSWPARFHENDTLNISFGSDYMLYDGTSFYVGGFASVDTPPYLTSHLVKLDNNGAIDVEFEPIKLKAMGVFDSDAVLTQNGIILDNLSFSDNRFGLAKYDFDANRIEDFELK